MTTYAAGGVVKRFPVRASPAQRGLSPSSPANRPRVTYGRCGVYQSCAATERYPGPARVSIEIGRKLGAFIGDEHCDQLGGLRVACVCRNQVG